MQIVIEFVYRNRSIEIQMAIIEGINQKEIDEEEDFNYLCSSISNDARYKREIKSRIFMSKATFKKYNPSLQILEEENVMCYI